MDNSNPQHREKKETLAKAPALTVRQLNEASEKMLKKDVNAPYTRAMADTDVLSPTSEDIEGLTFMQSEIINLMAKIAKKHPEADLSKLTPKNLGEIAKQAGIKVRVSELIALSKLEEIRFNRQSRLHRELKLAWPEWLNEAEQTRKGLGERYLDELKKNPSRTLLLTAAGAAGIYLGVKILGWLIGKGVEKAKGKASENKGWLIGGGLLGVLGLSALGLVKKDEIKKYLTSLLGIPNAKEEMQKLAKRAQEATSKEELDKIKKKIDQLREKTKQEAGVLEKAKKAKEELAWSMVGREVPTEERKRCIRYKEFFDKLNLGITLNPVVFAMAGHYNYESFTNPIDKFIESIHKAHQLWTKRNPEAAQQMSANLGTGSLLEFFNTYLKNEGEIKDFKGKTVYEVMDMIIKSPEEYIDREAANKTQKENKYVESGADQFFEALQNNPEKLKDKKWWQELFGKFLIGSVSMAIDVVGKTGGWIYKKGIPVVKLEYEMIQGTLSWIAGEMRNQESWLLKGSGYYFEVGAYTAAIGASLGTAIGALRGFTRFPSPTLMAKGALGGTIKGLWGGLKAPGEVGISLVKGAWDIPSGNFHPIWDMQSAIDQQRYIFEDLSVGFSGNFLGIKTLPEQIISGEIELSDRIIRQLGNYKEVTKGRIREMSKMSQQKWFKQRYTTMLNRYEKMLKQSETILELANEDRKKIDPTKWRKAMEQVKKNYGIDDEARKFLSSIEGVRGAPKSVRLRIGSILLFNPEHPLSRAISNNPKKVTHLFKLFDSNQELMKTFIKNPALMNDFRILNAIEKLDGKSEKAFVELFMERVTVWEGIMSKKELRLLSSNPEIISSYTRLTESIQNPQKSVQWIMESSAKQKGVTLEAFKKTDEGKKALNFAKKSLERIGIQNRLLQKIMMQTNSKRAQFIYQYIDDLDLLFENTAMGQKAVDHFLAIDNQVLKLMQKQGKWSELSEHFKNFSSKQVEIIEMVGKYEDDLKITGKMAKRIGKMKAGLYEKIDESTKEIAKKSKAALRRFRGVKLTATHIDELGKIKDFNQIKGLLDAQGIEVEKWAIRAISKTDDLDKIKVILRETTKHSSQYIRFVKGAEIGAKAIRILKPAAAVTFGVAAFVGAGFDFYYAASTDNKKKRNLYLQKGGISAVAGAAEVGTMIAAGAASGAAAAVGIAAASYVYMTDTAYESALEHETEPKEWAQNYDYDTLMHHWGSTGEMLSAGDAYRAFFTTDTRESIAAEHEDIKGNIVKALILTEGNRFEREDEYRTKYMEVVHDFQGSMDYEKAKGRLHESRLFAEAVHNRELLKKQGVKSHQLVRIDLMSDEFEFEKMGIDQMIQIRVNWEIFKKKEAVHPMLAQNFEQMSDGELLDYYWQLNKYINQNKETITDNETYFRDQIENYIFYARHIEANKACKAKWARAIREEMLAMGEIPSDPEKLQQAQKKATEKVMKNFDKKTVLSVMASIENNQALHFESVTEKITENEANYSLYQLAKSFGYIGIQNEEDLKQFFSEEKKGSLGIYWDGENWYVNEAGYEFDDKVGKVLNRRTIEKFIQELRDKPDDRLEHRQDAIVSGMSEIFHHKVLEMADLLEKSLGEYGGQHKKESVNNPLTS